MSEIGQWIAIRRQRQGWTQMDLAERVYGTRDKSHERYIGHWESGYRTPGLGGIARLAKAFGITPGELMQAPKEEKTKVA